MVFCVVIVYTITLHSMFIIVIHVIHGSNITFYDHDVRDRRGRDRMIGGFTIGDVKPHLASSVNIQCV